MWGILSALYLFGCGAHEKYVDNNKRLDCYMRSKLTYNQYAQWRANQSKRK